MITSTSNPEVRAVAGLHKRAERDRTGLFLVEGKREIQRAAAAGIDLVSIYRRSGSEVFELPGNPRSVELGELAFERLAYGRDGVVATARTPSFAIQDLDLPDPALVLVAESIEKPGNLGATLRSADAAGAGMIVANAVTDLVNPNVIRASVGSIFNVPVAMATSVETIAFLRQRSIKICAAIVDSGRAPWAVDLTEPVAIVIGNEDTGLSGSWSDAADSKVTVPMPGAADSLNASVAAAVILFEAIRQRSAT